MRPSAKLVKPGSFKYDEHYYTRVLNANLHPMVQYFFNLDNERLISRYCHLNPAVIPPLLERILTQQPQHFPWAGSDLFNVTDAQGRRQMVVIETNSCPSGQKSMPLLDENQEQGGYRALIQHTFKPLIESRRAVDGALAVIYDKNPMETTGYAAAIADVFNEPVYLAEFYDNDPEPAVKFEDGVLFVRDAEGQWQQCRAAFRYVTQRPWNRIPPITRSIIVNPVLACLAGGRNKLVAAKAYDIYNAELSGTGLAIRSPYTIRDVSKNEIPLWIRSLGGRAVIKVPYSNAGQGVFTVTNEMELERFMAKELPYEQYIVQSLIGNSSWTSRGGGQQLFHVGCIPTKKSRIFVADIRMMVRSGPDGFRPVAIYARKAREPLSDKLADDADSWSMLGTNLSHKNPDGSWGTDTSRLLLMDRRDFNMLGLGLDDLIEGFIQTVLSVIAIDRMATTLVTQKGKFRKKLYASLNSDKVLIDEILE